MVLASEVLDRPMHNVVSFLAQYAGPPREQGGARGKTFQHEACSKFPN